MKVFVLVSYTFGELVSKATIIVLAGISTLIILGTALAFSSSETDEGVTLLMFGQKVSPPLPLEEVHGFVGGVQVGLSKGMFAGIILFGIFATAGLIPETLQRGTADLYLSKPIARWELLLGRSVGAVVVMLANILYFIGMLWFVFGIKTGVWNLQFLLAGLTLTFAFACLFSIVALLGVLFRNAAIPIIGSFLYLVIVGGILHQREQTLYLISENGIYRAILDGLYYLFPQISGMQDEIAKQILQQSIDWKPFLQSFLSASLMFMGGAAVLGRRDF